MTNGNVSVFRSQVELNFCDQIKCTVPLTDEVQKKVQDAAKELLRVSQAAKDSDNKEHTLDDLCDSVMDAIDEILGEGMSDQILGMKEGYTFWDACDVFKYITDEINTAMRGVAASSRPSPRSRRSIARSVAQSIRDTEHESPNDPVAVCGKSRRS